MAQSNIIFLEKEEEVSYSNALYLFSQVRFIALIEESYPSVLFFSGYIIIHMFVNAIHIIQHLTVKTLLF